MTHPNDPDFDEREDRNVIECKPCRIRVDLDHDKDADEHYSETEFEEVETQTKFCAYVCNKCKGPMFVVPNDVLIEEGEIAKAENQAEQQDLDRCDY